MGMLGRFLVMKKNMHCYFQKFFPFESVKKPGYFTLIESKRRVGELHTETVGLPVCFSGILNILPAYIL